LEVFAPQRRCRSRYGLHLGMGSHIGQGFGQVVTTGNDPVFADNDDTDRNLPFIGACIVRELP
jgi:hypothetical protein